MNFLKNTLKYGLLLTILGILEMAGIIVAWQGASELRTVAILWIILIIIPLVITTKNLIRETKEKSPEHWIIDTLIPIFIAGIMAFFASVFLTFSIVH